MKRKLTLIVIAGFILIGFWQLLGTPIYSQDKPLTLGQVANSLNVSNDKEKESAITAKKVRQVGVTFPLTPEIEAELRNAGATDELLEAIRQNSPPISKPITQALNILSTPPESEIYIDEVLRGRTDASGNIRIADLPVGEYRIAVRKARYKEAVFSLSLSPDKEGQINANLELAVGFLTVKTNAPNPSIDISGLGRFDNPVSKFECQPGTYSVTISSPLYVTSREEVSVNAGQETELSVTLEVDSAARYRLISEALAAYSSQQYDRAITLAKTLLYVDSEHAEALAVLAQSHFMKDDFYAFSVFAKQAIDAGSSLEFNLLHHDFLMSGLNINSITEGLHPVKLTLTASSISLDPQVERELSCSFRKSSLPIENLSVAQVDETGGGFFKKAAGIYLKMVMRDPTNPKKTYTLNFTDPASDFVKETRGKTIIKSRAEAAQALTAIAALLNRTNKASIPPPPPPPTPKPIATPVSTPLLTPKSTPTISGKEFKNSIGMEFVRISSGSFMMGSNNGEADEKPVHRVTISNDFWMGKTEVTQGQWKAVMGSSPSAMSDLGQEFFGDDKPVVRVSWDDAQDFVRKLNTKNEGTYRLPTEAEWEYACRAGSTTKYSYGDGDGSLGSYAWYSENSGSKPHEVATKQANAWGLYDMHGNVWEWTQDWYGSYQSGSVTDPTGASSGSRRVGRGGGWSGGAVGLRSAVRGGGSPSLRGGALGFRLVKN